MLTEKRFKIGIFGPPESGKTCYLAALASPHVSNPRRFSATWEKQMFEEHDTELNSFTSSMPADVRGAYLNGIEWLSLAIKRLKSGDVPDGNANHLDASRFAFRFAGPNYFGNDKQSQSETVAYACELIDYSGELVKTDVSNDELSSRIRKHLLECDGFIVLAESPRPGRTESYLAEELNAVQGVFLKVAKQRRKSELGCPVALVVNKWDRFMPDWKYEPEESESLLGKFFDRHPLHASYRDAVYGTTENGKARSFLSSAFGRSTISTAQHAGSPTHDCPIVGDRMYSYGLEDPFMWLLAQSEHDIMEKLETKDRKLGFYNPLSVRTVTDFQHQLDHAIALLSGSSSSLLTVKKLHKNNVARSYLVRSSLGVVLAFACILIWQVGVAFSDYKAERQKSYVLTYDPMEPDEEDLATLDNSADWYRDYASRSMSRIISHLVVLGRSKANHNATFIRGKIGELAPIVEFQNNLSTLERKIQATDSLAGFDSLSMEVESTKLKLNHGFGDRSALFDERIRALSAKLVSRKQDYLSKNWELELMRIVDKLALTDLDEDLERLRESVDGLAASPFAKGMTSNLEAAKLAIDDRKKLIKARKDGESLEKSISQDLVSAASSQDINRIDEACGKIRQIDPASAHKELIAKRDKLIAQLKSSIPAIVENMLSQKIAIGDWNSAKGIRTFLEAGGRDFHAILGEEDTSLVLKSAFNLLQVPLERFYYQKFAQNPCRQTINEYMNDVTGDYRSRHVSDILKKYEQYLDRVDMKEEYLLAYGIVSYNQALSSTNKVNFTTAVNGRNVRFARTEGGDQSEVEEMYIYFKPSEREVDASVRQGYIKIRPTETVTLSVTTRAETVVSDAKWAGEALQSFTFEELAGGVVVELRYGGRPSGMKVEYRIVDAESPPPVLAYSDLI